MCKAAQRQNLDDRPYLWQGRFASFDMDEEYLLAAARYVELNPVRARLVERPQHWAWSNAKAHLAGRDDRLATVAPLLSMVADWQAFLRSPIPEETVRDLHAHGRTGRPLGSPSFLDRLEQHMGRVLKPQKPGPKPKPSKPPARRSTR